MKRTCKHVDITSLELIVPAVYECFRPYKKRHRADTRALFARVLDITPRAARRVLIRARRACRRGLRMGAHRARKLASYHGYTCAVACEKFLRRVGAEITYRIAFNSTRYAEN